jgi:DNA-binding response OmpR family regulator
MKNDLKRILIIDDDPDLRTVMNISLKKHGYTVDTASKKEEVHNKLLEFNPNIVLLDVMLSGSDGRNICREIKGMEQMKDVSIIMVSAHPGAAENISSYGADDFIAKPINVEMLIQKVEGIANKK